MTWRRASTVDLSDDCASSSVYDVSIHNDVANKHCPEMPLAPTTRPFTATFGVVEIILNTNAKGVTQPVVDLIQDIAHQHNSKINASTGSSTETGIGTTYNTQNLVRVHVTSTKDQAEQVARQIMCSEDTLLPPAMVIPIGGDGTLTTFLQMLWDAAKSKQQQQKQQIIEEGQNEVMGTEPIQFPPIGYIAMGTGNALGSVVGCRPARTQGRVRQTKWYKALTTWRRPSFLGGTYNRKLQTLAETICQLLAASETLCNQQAGKYDVDIDVDDSRQSIDIVELPLLQVTTRTTMTLLSSSASSLPSEGTETSSLCFFAGVGFDSLMLQDFKDLQEWTKHDTGSHHPLQMSRRVLKDSLSSILGYCVALVTRTLPQCVLEKKHLIQVQVSTNQPESTVWIDHRRGDVVRSILSESDSQYPGKTNSKKKTILYAGEAGIVAVGSSPFYGGGLRLFPFARMSNGGMQLRIGRIHPLQGTINIPRIFRGSYRDTSDHGFGCLDFMGSQFTIELLDSQSYPVQHSGDFIGTSSRIDFAMIPSELRPVRFVTLLPPRIVYEKQQ